ncbi:MAG: PilZ domain-containing protein [Terriglobia bacterium]
MNERRSVPRYLADVAAQISHAEGEGFKVIVEILSTQGACVRGNDLPAAGQRCRLTLQWLSERIQAEAEVAWKSHQGLAGLKFVSLDESGSSSLRELLATLRMQPVIPGKME